MSLVKSALRVYERDGEAAFLAWYEQLSDEQQAAFQEELDRQVRALKDVFRSFSSTVQEAANRLAAAMNEGKVRYNDPDC